MCPNLQESFEWFGLIQIRLAIIEKKKKERIRFRFRILGLSNPYILLGSLGQSEWFPHAHIESI